jgi:hypothetical protein
VGNLYRYSQKSLRPTLGQQFFHFHNSIFLKSMSYCNKTLSDCLKDMSDREKDMSFSDEN